MAAGTVDYECGARDVHRVNGMLRVIPISATLAIVVVAAMGGAPLLSGSLSKEMFFAATVLLHRRQFRFVHIDHHASYDRSR
ncbi:MAG TPA: proton-conducting transporter membrane subunit [Accumulibacter sp.]|uniref:proton-conducting transporter transmembrane domain-containing protein n=1 Tax=Accumulibacter sp. TaxID=2053492 RepID=UPI002C10E36B|nr:proton-conducting transporter membrane subunit [Accumulibacter sp.]HMW64438.1 proton-conducting transporter membrane subunit [Accumulibacter sp.]